jgi:short-subunit dehydrogenase
MGHDRFEGPDDIADVAAIMATNFYGTVYCTGELLPLLLESTPSSVVNVASVAGRLAAAGASAYCASKFAVVGWSEALHFDLLEKGVCVSLVEPGFVPTEGFPQTGLIDHPVFKYAMGSTEGVSAAILDAIKNRKLERTTPRWYYALQVPRLLSPPLYRLVQEKVVKKVSW